MNILHKKPIGLLERYFENVVKKIYLDSKTKTQNTHKEKIKNLWPKNSDPNQGIIQKKFK